MRELFRAQTGTQREVETKGNGGADSEIWGLRLTPLCIPNYYKKTVVFQMLDLSVSFRDSDEPRILSLRLGKRRMLSNY